MCVLGSLWQEEDLCVSRGTCPGPGAVSARSQPEPRLMSRLPIRAWPAIGACWTPRQHERQRGTLPVQSSEDTAVFSAVANPRSFIQFSVWLSIPPPAPQPPICREIQPAALWGWAL